MSLAFWRRWNNQPDCREVRRLMQAFVDGELPAGGAERVAAHLQDCDRCGVDAETYRRVKQRLTRLRAPADPTALSRLERFVEELTSGTPDG